MKNAPKRGRIVAMLLGGLALASAPLTVIAQTPGAGPASANANPNASANGGNLGQGAAPLPEPGTWIAMGSLIAVVAGLAIAKKRKARA